MSKKKSLILTAIAIAIIIIILIIVSVVRNTFPRVENVFSDVEPEPPQMKYGFVIDSFYVEEDVVQKNENLSNILLKHGVSMQTIDKIAKKSVDVFNVKKIRSGNPYSILKTNDTLAVAQYFIYENDLEHYTVFQLFDSLKIYQEYQDISLIQDTMSGVITSSLWNAIIENGGNPDLAVRLSDVYEWTIDFFSIQQNDEFHVIYEKKMIDDKEIGSGNILAALFSHEKKDFYAFYYQQDTTMQGEYFDEKGESLRRQFLKAPLQYSRISSKFSNSRMHPILRISRPHHGVDYAAPVGTSVRSIGNGKVIAKAYQKGGGGNYLKIKHNSVYTTVYMHLNGYAKGIAVGTQVSQGQIIGYVGSTGSSTGPHLDFRVFKNGTAIDPLKMESPPALPVKKALMENYLLQIEPIKQALNAKKAKS